jgi:hypothetical protein
MTSPIGPICSPPGTSNSTRFASFYRHNLRCGILFTFCMDPILWSSTQAPHSPDLDVRPRVSRPRVCIYLSWARLVLNFIGSYATLHPLLSLILRRFTPLTYIHRCLNTRLRTPRRVQQNSKRPHRPDRPFLTRLFRRFHLPCLIRELYRTAISPDPN